MQSQIQKWGNSLGLRIPMQLAKKLNLHPGSSVTLEIENDRLILTPKYNLQNFLNEITIENQHHQLLEGGSKGNEEW